VPKRFLVIQTAFLGDAVLATALLEKLHAFFPDAAIDLVVRKGNDGLFTPSSSPGRGGKCTIAHTHPFLRKLFIWDKRSNKTRNLFKLIGELRKERYDHIINCQRFFSTGLMTMLARGGEKIGYDKNPLAPFFDRGVQHRIPAPAELRPYGPASEPHHLHEVDRLNDLIEHLTDKSRPLPKLYPTPQDHEVIERPTRYVCIAPTSVWFTKQWSEEKWAELIRMLPQEMKVFLLGAPDDAAACSRIAEKAGRGEVLAGKLSLLGTAHLMAGAAMNYVNDSAPLHIASALSAPVTAVFCSTVPAFGFGPLCENGRVVEISEALYCRPCGLHGYKSCPEGHFKCALSIQASAVL
jgi:ADP-heptose:LPS heptosyltransferase